LVLSANEISRSIGVFSRESKPAFSLLCRVDDHSPTLRLYDDDGRVRFEAP